ncbi:MAG: 8-oxo-dGTP diphosphatase MutT [Vicinamibacterales bacterium]
MTPPRQPVTTMVVTAAVIEREGRFLVTRRLEGTHLAGVWEFPGGKCGNGETLTACLARELREELGVDCLVGDQLFDVAHDYPDRRVHLHFFACTLLGEPQPLLGQEMRWVAREDLRDLEFPPADDALIRRLAHPDSAREAERA